MELVKVNHEEFGVEESKAKQIAEQFKPMLDQMESLEVEANKVLKMDKENPETGKIAKEVRLKYVKVRTGTAAIHKVQKAFYLAAGRYVDGWKNAQIFASEGVEEKLMALEKHQENLEKERIENLQESRSKELSKFLSPDSIVPDHLGMLNDEIWNNYITGAKQNHETQLAAEKKDEEERLEKEKIRMLSEERDEHLINNDLWRFRGDLVHGGDLGELTKKKWSEMIKYLTEKKDAEIKKIADQEKENKKLKAEAEAQEKKLEKERLAREQKEALRIEADRKEREAAEKKRLEQQRIADAKLETERKEKEKISAELKAKKEAEEKAEEERLEKIEAELNKGDAAKLKDLLSDLDSLKTKYAFKSAKNKSIYFNVGCMINKAISLIED